VAFWALRCFAAAGTVVPTLVGVTTVCLSWSQPAPCSCRTWVAGHWGQVWGQHRCPPAVPACWELRKCCLLWSCFVGVFCGFLFLCGVLFFVFEKFGNCSPFYFSWSCKCSSHHFYPCVLYQCRRVLCCYIPGGNNISCLASPQHEEDRVGWQVCIQAFQLHFWDTFTQICWSSGLRTSTL